MNRKSFRILAGPIRRGRRDLTLAIVAATIAQASGIPMALLTRRLLHMADRGASLSPGNLVNFKQAIWIFGVALVGLALVRGVCRFLQGAVSERFAQRVIADIRVRMLDHLQRLSLGYFDRRATGKVIIRFVGDAPGLRTWLARTLVRTPADVLTILGVAVALGLISWPLLIAAAAPPLVLLPSIIFINSGLRRWTRQGRREQSRLTGELTDRLSMIGPIKAAGAERASLEELSLRIGAISDAFVRRGRLDAWCNAVALTAGSLSISAIGIWGSHLLLQGRAGIGDIIAAVWFTVLIRAPINRLTSASLVHQRFVVTMDRIDALLARRSEPGLDENLSSYTGEKMRLRFKNIGYRDARGRWVVRGICRTISGPGCVLLTGDAPTARTLFEIILRLRRPHEGRVTLDRVNARRLRVDDIRDRIRWVDRARAVIPATLASNQSEGFDALERAWSETALIAPSASFNTLVKEHGETLKTPAAANAEGLRLALACALTTDPTILLIDNPTDGLDDDDVERLGRWIENASRHRLLLIASDDSSMRRVAQKVIPLDEAPFGSNGLAHERTSMEKAGELATTECGAPAMDGSIA